MITLNVSILVKHAWIALLQQKLRAALSVSGVVCGVTAVFTMASIGQGAKQEAITQIEQMGTRNVIIHQTRLSASQAGDAITRHSQGLTSADALQISNVLPGYADSASLVEVQADVSGASKNISPQVVGVSAGYQRLQPVQIIEGRFINQIDSDKRNRVAVVGIDVATSIQQGIGGVVRISKMPFEIVGIVKNSSSYKNKTGTTVSHNYSQMLFIPLGSEVAFAAPKAANNYLDITPLSEIIVQLSTSNQSLPAAKVIANILAKTHNDVDDYTIVAPYQLVQQLKKTQRTFNIILGSISGISLLVGGIGIMNIMLATVSERKREVGVRRAVGAKKRDIWLQFLAEAMLLTCVGGVVGVLVGFITVIGISYFTGWEVAIHWLTVFTSLAMSLIVGIISGVYPAYMATQIDPMSALRSE